jgi:hypothetical protein
MYPFRKLSFAASLCALLCVAAAQEARADTITFDDVTGTGLRPIAGDRYQSQGVLLSTNGAGLFVNGGGTTNVLSAGGPAQVTINFVLPGTTTPGVTDSVTLFTVGSNALGTFSSAQAFDINGNLLGTRSASGGAQLVFSVAGINRVVFTPAVLDFGSIDTLTFNTPTAAAPSAVPEPATLILFGTGLTGVIGAARRRRRQAQQ